MSDIRRFLNVAVGTVALLVLPMAGRVTAQERPGPALEFIGGWVGFADDGIVSEGVIGGSARWYLSPRLGFGPEVLYIAGDNHSHFVLTGNLTWDLVPSTGSQQRAVIPFLVVGGGLYQTRESFPGETFTSSEGAFTAGGGVRGRVSDRVTVGADMRVGWELHVRVNATIGVRLGR